MNVFLSILSLFFIYANGAVDWSEDMNFDKWHRQAKVNIESVLRRRHNRNVAKNIIMFLGDGMGITTVTAGRILKGQLKGRNGEEEITFMESLDNAAYSKTYNINAQTADSAGTATAYLCGAKTRIGVIGLDGKTEYANCKSSKNSKLDSIAKWAHDAGKSVGIVTTTRVTHASPSAVYAHSASREWEGYDGKDFTKANYDDGCRDIASQLVDDAASYINLVFAGGRQNFIPNTTRDYGINRMGRRVDGRNLVNDWIRKMEASGKSHKFIWNATDFRNLEVDKYDHVLGLLAWNHMEYETSRVDMQEPSIVEMTEKAIKILKRNPNGYFLFVEGGKIDHGHHESKAHLALNDFVVFDDAVGKGLSMTSKEDTLVVVTADHSHTFTLGGYANRGNDIFGLVYNSYGNLSGLNLTYTSLAYANGPGTLRQVRTRNLTDAEVKKADYKQESAVYMDYETHGGEDVPIYANGPMSFLFEGTVEQSYIAHAMAYSACIGPHNNLMCRRNRGIYNSSTLTSVLVNPLVVILVLLLLKEF